MAKYKKHKHAMVLFLLACLLAAFLFPVVLSTVHQHNHCTVQDCPVCTMIHSAHDFLKRLLLAFAVALASVLADGLILWNRAVLKDQVFALGGTPVALRVRMNN